MKRHKINVWSVLPVVVRAVRVGLSEVAEATAEDSDEGSTITKAEAHDIARAVGSAVAQAVSEHLEAA